MFIYLVQHGEPKSAEQDPDKSLSDKGKTDAAKIGRFFSNNPEINLSHIFHSGKTRTHQTAEILSQYLTPKNNFSQSSGLSPLDDPSIWAEKINEFSENIMLVGLLRHLNRLAGLLLCNDENKNFIQFRMGGIVCLSKQSSNLWLINWMVPPNILK